MSYFDKQRTQEEHAMIWTKTRRALSASLAAVMLGGLLAAPVTAHAEDGKAKKKGDSGTIIVGPPIITNDPPPKKK